MMVMLLSSTCLLCNSVLTEMRAVTENVLNLSMSKKMHLKIAEGSLRQNKSLCFIEEKKKNSKKKHAVEDFKKFDICATAQQYNKI